MKEYQVTDAILAEQIGCKPDDVSQLRQYRKLPKISSDEINLVLRSLCVVAKQEIRLKELMQSSEFLPIEDADPFITPGYVSPNHSIEILNADPALDISNLHST